MLSQYMKTALLFFFIFLILTLVVLAFSPNKSITSIYTHEGFTSDMKLQRMAGVVYSGDILDICDSNTNERKYMNRQEYNSEVSFIKPEDPNVTTNLSKLRIVSSNHQDKSMQVPIKYGDTVMIAHNAYIENKNQTRYVKYGEKLQTHQTGEMFRTYKLLNPANLSDTNFIKYDSPIFFRKTDTSDEAFLTVEKDNSVTTKNKQDNATKFYLVLKRDYEAYENNLCICEGEVLYP